MPRILKSNLSETLILLITSVALIFPQISFATLAEENKELGPKTSLKFPPETFHTIIDKVARNSSKRRMAINIKLALTNKGIFEALMATSTCNLKNFCPSEIRGAIKENRKNTFYHFYQGTMNCRNLQRTQFLPIPTYLWTHGLRVVAHLPRNHWNDLKKNSNSYA